MGGQRVGEIELIHEVLKYENDQLRAITEWLSIALQNETTVCQKSFTSCVQCSN
ncbi:uncharacterized protein E5676_scaffold480G00020 [Cucumis melo var. makuwa]|uniref:Uncharacterized protein n=1 Tax=Cucumis melo var. makuwa TaxID=1194695 RepID=A0A5A7UR32_CUCMM|nr:uncharacterized protein E6C27_scaffold96G002790 [Cucumis melo var. makuwa]TYK20622.1 uncharacterized protein E5676_scaffold480G00020 [Cucumis melo var. makuwa]